MGKEINMAPEENKNSASENFDFAEYWASQARQESIKEKFIRKVKENPFVPIGCGLTVGVLGYGLASFLRGDGKMQQYMMRARVVAQGSTVGAVILGLGYATYKEMKAKKQKEMIK